MTEGKDLLQVLWSGADVLRGKIDANEYKTYLLGLVFYKYLSDSYLSKAYGLLNDEIPDDLQEAQKVYEELSKKYNCEYDEAGSIGKRYRRQDEIGTPWCITYDFDSEADESVTVRDRDTMEQVRVKIAELDKFIEERLAF